MSDAEENNAGHDGLDISEYIPGNDLKNPPSAQAETEEERQIRRKRSKFRRKLVSGLLALFVSILLLSLGLEARETGVSNLIQYIFLYFILETVFTENRYTFFLSFGMLVCFWLLLAGVLPPAFFIQLTTITLIVFLFLEENKWLLAMNILVLGTWLLLAVPASLNLGQAAGPR